jgi:hypothetical protein
MGPFYSHNNNIFNESRHTLFLRHPRAYTVRRVLWMGIPPYPRPDERRAEKKV